MRAFQSLAGGGSYRPLLNEGGKEPVLAATTEELRSWRNSIGPPSEAWLANGKTKEPQQAQLSPEPEGADENADIVQFTCPIYVVEDGEGKLRVDVMRLGSLQGACEVSYYTAEGSAKAWQKYIPASGKLILPDGEPEVSFEISLVKSNVWSATMEFKLHLEKPVNCNLGQYLHRSRVKVIDAEPFPSAKYKSQLSLGESGVKSVNKVGLFVEYARLMYNVPGIRTRAWATVMFDQMHNIYLVLTLLINLYLVDTVFNTKNPETWDRLLVPGDRNETLKFVSILYISPILLLHFWDIIKVRMDVEGLAEDYMKRNMFRKYLNYSDESRRRIKSADIQLVLMNDIPDLAAGYDQLLESVRVLGKLFLQFLFVAFQAPQALWCCAVIPSVMMLWGFARNRVLLGAVAASGEATSATVALVDEACSKYRLIADYRQRPKMNELFEVKIKEFRAAVLPENTVRLNNEYFPKWLGPSFVSFFMWWQGPAVISENVSLGAMLATINVLRSISADAQELYCKVMRITSTFDALETVTTYLNMATDLQTMKDINRQRREHTRTAREEIMKSRHSGVQFRSDLIPLQVIDVSFQYSLGVPVLAGANISVLQGNLVAVLGPHGSGKSTFLELLGHSMFPTLGQIFLPTYLRILHVSREPVLLDLSPWKNITFGLADPNNIKPWEALRIRGIMEKLDMKKTLEFVEADLAKILDKGDGSPTRGRRSDEGKIDIRIAEAGEKDYEAQAEWEKAWQAHITYTEKVKIHIARALVMNPEILVMQRPLHHFDRARSQQVFDLIKAHVQNRGLGMPDKDRQRRRPRTVFFTPETAQQAREADVIWQIDNATKGITSITAGQVNEDFIPPARRRHVCC